jgi:hypothetical protein
MSNWVEQFESRLTSNEKLLRVVEDVYIAFGVSDSPSLRASIGLTTHRLIVIYQSGQNWHWRHISCLNILEERFIASTQGKPKAWLYPYRAVLHSSNGQELTIQPSDKNTQDEVEKALQLRRQDELSRFLVEAYVQLGFRGSQMPQ